LNVAFVDLERVYKVVRSHSVSLSLDRSLAASISLTMTHDDMIRITLPSSVRSNYPMNKPSHYSVDVKPRDLVGVYEAALVSVQYQATWENVDEDMDLGICFYIPKSDDLVKVKGLRTTPGENYGTDQTFRTHSKFSQILVRAVGVRPPTLTRSSATDSVRYESEARRERDHIPRREKLTMTDVVTTGVHVRLPPEYRSVEDLLEGDCAVVFRHITIPKSYYESPAELCEFISWAFEIAFKDCIYQPKIRFEYCDRNQRLFVSWNGSYEAVLVSEGKALALLGVHNFDKIAEFPDNIETPYVISRKQRQFYSESPIVLRKMTTMYLYSNIIQNSMIGDIEAKVLGHIAINDVQYGKQYEKRFNPLIFTPLCINYLNTIEIKLADPTGREIEFSEGEVVVELLIKRKV
jgi:hypothetical protein